MRWGLWLLIAMGMIVDTAWEVLDDGCGVGAACSSKSSLGGEDGGNVNFVLDVRALNEDKALSDG
jgi:hypothetical protein